MFIHNRLGMVESVETLLAQQQRLNQVSNNLANVDTAGYKKESVTFDEMLYNVTKNRQRVGKALNILTNHQQGTVQLTGNPLDIAISGPGFFKIDTPQGPRYTRAGNFELTPDGQLKMPNGGLVVGEGGPIVVEGSEVVIDRAGRVQVDGQVVNQLSIVTFADLRDLEKVGENLFRAKRETAQEQPAPDAEIKQGFIEKANVNTVEEMTELIDLQRAYEGQQKMIRAIDDIDNLAARRVGSLNG
ncbi:MAG TPA: flagellar basal-body rod protein FlgF [Desulfurivibrionaceae bacterium]|nr:flagellar basal-body rod protein FlgF [Desulfurivibrionaceae bacterium]